jgi:uncharacterized membrane protein
VTLVSITERRRVFFGEKSMIKIESTVLMNKFLETNDFILTYLGLNSLFSKILLSIV